MKFAFMSSLPMLLLIAMPCPSLARRQFNSEEISVAVEDDTAMKEARQELIQKIENNEDPLLASQKFSLKALRVAENLYKPLAEKANLPKHALLVGGSGGRYEMSTFSDLEYLVVFDSGDAEKLCEKDKKIIQTLDKTLRTFRSRLKKSGLESDAINQPSVRKGSIACSPDKLALGRLLSGDEVTTSMVLETTFLAGDETVATEVRKAVRKWLNTDKADALESGHVKVTRRTRDAISGFAGSKLGDWVNDKLKTWKLNFRMEHALKTISEGLDAFNIKSTLYRPLQRILFMDTLNAPVDDPLAFNALKKLEWLQETGKWSPTLVHQVKTALSATVRARMLAHEDAHQEQDEACLACGSTTEIDFSGFHVPALLQNGLKEAGNVVLCVGTKYMSSEKVPKKCAVP